MKGDDRKAVIAAYKKRETVAGIYAIRCAATNQAWVGRTLNLDTVQNRIWFSLRVGSNSNRDLPRGRRMTKTPSRSSRSNAWRMRNCPMSGTPC